MAKKSSTDIVLNSDASLVYLPKVGGLVKIGDKPKQQPQSPSKIDFNHTPYFPWGLNNDYPGEVLDKVEKNTIIGSTLMWKANQMSAGGVVYGEVSDDGSDFTPLNIPEIEDWLGENNMELYLEETLRDLYWWSNSCPDLYLNKKRTVIASMVSQEAMDCRFSRMDKKGRKKLVYVDGNWPRGLESTWTEVDCLDPYYGVLDQIRKSISTRFIYPLSFSSPGEKYYQRAPWHSIIDSGWLDVAEKISTFKKALMDNSMSLKYVIHVPESWWKWKFKDWEKLSEAVKKTNQVAVLKEFNDVLTGVANVGKTLMLTFKHDSYGKQFTKWEVIPLGFKIENGAYVEDSQEASSHILYALLVDGTLIGNSPGKGMGAGSGSDKMRANNIFVISNKVYVDKALSPLNKIITPYNGWNKKFGKRIEWRSKAYLLATLDTGKPVQNAPSNPTDDPNATKKQ